MISSPFSPSFPHAYPTIANITNRQPEIQIDLFADPSSQGFFSTPANAPDLILRLKDGMDNAEPSANGVSASNLHRLSAMLSDAHYARLARGVLSAFSAEIMQHPFLFPSMLAGVVALKLGVGNVQVVGPASAVGEGKADGWARALGGKVGANRTVVRIGEGVKCEWLRRRSELLRELEMGRERVTVCEDGRCRDLGEEELSKLVG